MRNLPATVFSTTLKEPLDWPDATFVNGDAVAIVARLKEESDVPLRSHGSLSLNRVLMAAGLVDRAGTLDEALAWAHEIAELAPLVLAHNKLVLNGGDDEAVHESFQAVWASEDVREAAAARAEKRSPEFTGR